jgi:hypothetical protein
MYPAVFASYQSFFPSASEEAMRLELRRREPMVELPGISSTNSLCSNALEHNNGYSQVNR